MNDEKLIYASLLHRALAFFVDFVLLLILNVLFFFLLQQLGIRITPEKENPLVSILLLLLNWLYFSYLESSAWQATPGKMVTGIVIVNEQAGKISFKQATQRFILAFLTLFTLFIGYFIAWRNPKRQTIHDRFSKTFVVKKSKNEVGKAEENHYIKNCHK